MIIPRVRYLNLRDFRRACNGQDARSVFAGGLVDGDHPVCGPGDTERKWYGWVTVRGGRVTDIRR